MKLATCTYFGSEQPALVSAAGDAVCLLPENGFPYASMNDLILNASPDDLARIAHLEADGAHFIPLGEVRLCAPIPVPIQDVLCLGENYRAHVLEAARFLDKEADDKKSCIYFSKRTNRATADGEAIPSHRGVTSQLDYEAELAFILGADALNVPEEDAFKYIFGYTIINDITARDLQRKHTQWYFGKSLEGFCPMGPWIVTADEIPAPPALTIQSYVNGELRQDSCTDHFIHTIPKMIAELSSGMTLKAGTIISTGTPAGVGSGFIPPKYLQPGDEIVCKIEGIGTLTNRIAE